VFYAATLDRKAEEAPTMKGQGMEKIYRPFGTFRFVLAVMVMGQHFGWLAPASFGNELPKYATGNVAVLTFFALSGFIIVEAGNTSYIKRPLAFAVNRVLRIVPPLIVAFVVSILTHFVLFSSGTLRLVPGSYVGGADVADIFNLYNVVANIVSIAPVASKMFPMTYEFIPYTWALLIEVAFYGLFACLLVVSSGRRRLMSLVAAWSFVMVLVWMVALESGGLSTLKHMIFFAFGACVYGAANGRVMSFLIAGLLFLCCMAEFAHSRTTCGIFYFGGFSETKCHLQYVEMATCLLAIYILAVAKVGSAFRKLDARLGDLSYAIYLNQFSVIVLLLSLGEQSYTLFAVGVVSACLVGVVLTVLVEPLFRAIRDRVRGAPVGGGQTGDGAGATALDAQCSAREITA
jgi:peptidoglycan/LPS O-acetylase OafA/YrhL